MDLPCFARLDHDLVDLILGSDIDTSGRLIHDQDIRVVCQPSGNNNLLLVTTGERLDQCLAARCFDTLIFAILSFTSSSIFPLLSFTPTSEYNGYREQSIYYHAIAQASKNTASTTVLCDHSDTDLLIASCGLLIFSRFSMDLDCHRCSIWRIPKIASISSVLCAPTSPPKPKDLASSSTQRSSS